MTIILNYGISTGKLAGGEVFDREVDLTPEQEAAYMKAALAGKSFEDSLSKLSSWITTPVRNKYIVYTGDFENTASDIKVINYRHLLEYLPQNIE